jgi:3'-phosphoadenosine 5'-phosphosulfate sulfotransferase (PAPS reductase)/FAD synthetase
MQALTIGPGDWRKRIAGRRVVVSYSGGKDSAAVCGALRDAGIDFDAVYFDTGWESPTTYQFLAEYGEQVVGKPLTRLAADLPVPEGAEAEVAEIEGMLGHRSDMVRRCFKYMTPPSRMTRWCTGDLKLAPFERWAKEQAPFVNAIGVRAQESAARSRQAEWEAHPTLPGVDVWRPVFHWTEEDVIAAHHRFGLPVNELYLRGSRRVGCWPCIMASKNEIRTIASDDPARIAVIRRMEQLIEAGQERKGKRKYPVGWFMNPRPKRCPKTRKYLEKDKGLYLPIDLIVQWSGTHEKSLLDEMYGDERGCMRWGMCSRPTE